MAAEQDIALSQLCGELSLSRRAFKRLVERFPELGLTPHAHLLTPDEAARVREVVAWERAGLPEEEVRTRLLAAAERAPALAEQLAQLGDKLERLQRAIGEQDARRQEDRDRLLTALVRTQQELSHLRYELAARTSRRDRKRGLLRRLLGR